MPFHTKMDAGSSEDSAVGCQKISSDYSELLTDHNSRDTLPKYYPKDHEVTRWLINQMRCRNGLHHLVNFANIQPTLLSAYFEIFDQPHLYIEARTGPGMPAYNIKTVLYLTPLAIALYFRLRSVLRLLLDTSGSRIHARARQEIDVNATCYVRRTKPRPGPFVMDEYSTTCPAIIAVRREFFPGLSMLMAAGFQPQAPIGVIERLGTNREATYWFVDLLDFCVKLLNTRPGVDVIGLLQTISYRASPEHANSATGYYDPCVYDIRPSVDGDPGNPDCWVWCSVFQRIARKGASREYSNCGNRLIGLLEHFLAAGFFRQKCMPKGPVEYDAELTSRKASRIGAVRKMNPETICKLNGPEEKAARQYMAADRDACISLLTLWLERVRNRCLDRQAQRLYRLLTNSMAETELLTDFLFAPQSVDTNMVIYPHWLAMGLARNITKRSSSSPIGNLGDVVDEEANEMCELEPPQLNEIRQEIGTLAHALGLADYSHQLVSQRVVETFPFRGEVGDAFGLVSTREKPKGDKVSRDRTPQNRCASEDCENQLVKNNTALDERPPNERPKADTGGSRPFWLNPNRLTTTMSPPVVTTKPCEAKTLNRSENQNNVMLISKPEIVADVNSTKVVFGLGCDSLKTDMVTRISDEAEASKAIDESEQRSRSAEQNPQPKTVIKRPVVWRTRRVSKQKAI